MAMIAANEAVSKGEKVFFKIMILFQPSADNHIITKEGTPRSFECADWEKDMKREILNGKENIHTSKPEEELPNFVIVEEGYFCLCSRCIRQFTV